MTIIKTVGIGGDYGTWCAARNSLGYTVTDDFDFVSISDIAETTPDAADYCDLNGHTIRFLSGSSHYGKLSGGHITNMSSNVILHFNLHGSGTIVIDGLNLKRIENNTSTYKSLLLVQTRDTVLAKCRNLILNNDDKEFTKGMYAGTPSYGNIAVEVSNVKCNYSGSEAIQVEIQAGGSGHAWIENCTAYRTNHGIGFSDASAVSVKNCASLDTVFGYYGTHQTFTPGASNASVSYCGCSNSDLSGYEDCKNDLIAADEFESIDPGSDSFLLLNMSVLHNSGTVPMLETTDIAGDAYGESGEYPIGCHQRILPSVPPFDEDDVYVNLIPEQLKRIYGGTIKGEPTKFSKEIRSFSMQVKELTDTAHIVHSMRSIDAALQYGIDQGWSTDKNPLLDDIGDIIGQPRYNHTNAEYAVLLRARIQMNASRGEPERIIAAIRSICQTEQIRYEEYYPASIVVEFESDTVPEGLNLIMQKIASGGVNIGIVASTTDAFAFSDDGTLGTGDTVHGFAPVDQSSGGKFSSLIV